MYFHSKWEDGYTAYYRFWWTIVRRFGISGDINLFHDSCGVSFTIGTGHIQFYIGIPFVVSFWLTIGHDHGGQDATYSICTPAKTIAEDVGNIVGSSLNDRVRYGGWDDWI